MRMPAASRILIKVIVFILLIGGFRQSAADEIGPIRLAAILPLSGKADSYGHPALKGARIAVAEINLAGGVLEQHLVLLLLDNRSTPLNARQAARTAVDQNVIGVVGSLWSTHSLAVASVLQEAGVPMISPGSTAPEVTRVGHFIFRTCYTDDFQGSLMAEFATQDLGCRKAAIMINISETYSQTLARYFAGAFTSKGGEVVYQGGYKGTSVDFGDLLMHLKPLSPEVVFIPGYSQDSGLLIKQAAAMGIRSIFIGGDAWETNILDFSGPALEGSYFSTHWHPGVPYNRNREFIALYKKQYGDEPISPFAPLAYDAVWLFANAIRRANSLDRHRIRDALADTQKFAGATGYFSFDVNGDPVKKGAGILKFEGGKWRFHKAFEP